MVTVSDYTYRTVMTFSVYEAVKSLLSWCDDVVYWKQRNGEPQLVCRFDSSDGFFRWKDWIGNAPLVMTYVRRVDDVVIVTVPVLDFFKSLMFGESKWHVSNQRE